MAINTVGLNLMVDGIGQLGTLYINAYAGAALQGSAIVTYNSASGGIADIVANAVITIAAGVTVTVVRLTDSALGTIQYASKTISAAFPSGGDLIVESYELSVTSTD